MVAPAPSDTHRSSTPARTAQGRNVLELIQVYRGLAAVIVMLYHVTTINHFYFPFLSNVFRWGHSGIDFFFVLSGFIMLYVHYDKAGHARQTWRFLATRAVRIFPLYWCVLAVTVILFWRFPPSPDLMWSPRSTLEPTTLWHALFLIDPNNAIVPVAWTLTYEVIFYLFFALYISCGARIFSVLAAAWCAALIAQWAGIISWPHPILLRTIVLHFFLGCLAAVLVIRFPLRNIRWWWVALAMVPCAIVAVGELRGTLDAYKWYGIPYFLIIVAGAAYDQATHRRYPRFLVLLGEASYAIYLIHYGMIIIFFQTIHYYRGFASKGPNTTLILLSLLIVAAGILVHFVIERPLLRHGRRRLGLSA